MSRARRSHVGTGRLLLRTVSADLSVSVLVAVLTLLVAIVAGLVPRAVSALTASDLAYAAQGVPATQRDVAGTIAGQFPAGADPTDPPSAPTALQQIYGRLDSALARTRTGLRQPLRGVLQSPHYVVRNSVATEATVLHAAEPVTPPGVLLLQAAADPDYLDHVTFVDGVPPATWQLPDGAGAGFVPPDRLDLGDAAGVAMPLALSVETAAAMKLKVGDILSTGGLGTVQISGLFEAEDPHGDYWANTPSIQQVYLFDDHDHTPRYTGTGFVAPQTMGLIASFGEQLTTKFWYPVADDAVTVDNAQAVADGIRGLKTTEISIPSDIAGSTVRAPVQSALDQAIDGSLARISATLALISILASGPLGVVLAVFALGVRAVIERRAAALALAGARGAAPVQLRGAAAIEGLLLGLPAGMVGAVVAALLVPGGSGWAWLAPVLVGCVPAVLFAGLGGRRGFRTTRRDLSARARGGIRTAVELGLIVLALLAAYLLLRRGRVNAGIDPLLALTPLLLALAASVVVLRLLPLALHAASALSRAGRGVVAFVGSARAMRDPALGVAAALSVVVGISAAVFSSVVLTTVDAGSRDAATTVVGAPVRADRTVFTPAQRARVAALPGVDAVGPVMNAGELSLGLNGRTDNVTVLLTDARALHAVRPEVPAALAAKSGGRAPVLISQDLADDDKVGDRLRLGLLPVTIVGVLPADAGFGANSSWVLLDQAATTAVDQPSFAPDTLLVALTGGADSSRVAAEVRRAAPDAVVDDVDAEVATVRSAPAASGLRLALRAAAAIGALLAALAVFAGSVSAAASRNRSIGMLRTMGMSARQSLGLVAWEIVPVVVAAAVIGAALGLAMPSLVIATTDLAPFTGGSSDLVTRYDPVQLAVVLLGFLAVAGAATLVAVLLARRSSPATTVKMGAE